MIKFICDTCNYESDSYKLSKNNNELIPTNWITISNATFHNDKHVTKGLIYAGGVTMHFCSTRCFTERFIGKPEIEPPLPETPKPEYRDGSAIPL